MIVKDVVIHGERFVCGVKRAVSVSPLPLYTPGVWTYSVRRTKTYFTVRSVINHRREHYHSNGSLVPSVPSTFEHLMLLIWMPPIISPLAAARRHDAEDAYREACLRAYPRVRSLPRRRCRAWLLNRAHAVIRSCARIDREPAARLFVDGTHGSIPDAGEANAIVCAETKKKANCSGSTDRLPPSFAK